MPQANDFSIRLRAPYYTSQGSGSPCSCARPDKAPLPFPAAFLGSHAGWFLSSPLLLLFGARLTIKKKEVSLGLSPLSAKGGFEGMNKKRRKKRKKEEAESSTRKETGDKANK